MNAAMPQDREIEIDSERRGQTTDNPSEPKRNAIYLSPIYRTKLPMRPCKSE